MFQHLLSFLPPPPAKVLDVGCGLGLSAHLLSEKGYSVTAIEPSYAMIDYAKKRYGDPHVEFLALGFLDEDTTIFHAESYDILFFLESTQHLPPLDAIFEKARRLLKYNGLLVVGDEVCYDRATKPETASYMSTDFIVSLSENGFRIYENEKIGERVARTCDVVIQRLTEDSAALISGVPSQDAGEKLLSYIGGWEKKRDWYSLNKMGYEIFAAKKDNYFIKPYSSGDEEKIVPMFREIFGTPRSDEHWRWKFRDNPYGAHKISEVFSENDTLVAHYAGYPVPFFSSVDEPRDFLSYQIGDTMTSPAVRNIGLGKTGLLARMAQHFYAKFCEGNLTFIYGFNTGKIKKLGERYLRYTYIDPVTLWVKNLSKSPFKPSSYLRRLLSGYSVDSVSSVGGEWDKFFDGVRDSYQFLVHRDAAYVEWRYLKCPDKIHKVFAVRERGRLVGWSVFTREGDKVRWGDALFDDAHPEAVLFLLSSLFQKEFSTADSIEGWFSRNPAWWPLLLKGMGFEITQEPNNITPCFVVFDDQSRLERLNNHFYYTLGDSDLF